MKDQTRSSIARLLSLFLTILITMFVVVGLVWAEGPGDLRTQKERFKWIVTKRLTVDNQATFNGDVDVEGDVTFGGGMTIEGDLIVEGDSDLYGDITSSEGAITMTDLVRIEAERDGTTGYDYFLTITGDITGTINNAKTYGLYIDMTRPSTAPPSQGNIDDAGIKVRVDNESISGTTGMVLNAIDVQAKNDDNGIWAGTLRGAQITADTDTGSYTDIAYGLRVYVEGEGVITTTMQLADFELSRKVTASPTDEYGIIIRNTSLRGDGADAALRIESSYGAGGWAATDNWDFGIDLNPSDILTADIRLSQGETIENLTKGEIGINANLEVTGTSDLRGYIFDGAGDVTVADNLAVTMSLTVTLNTDLQGTLESTAGDLDIVDNVAITGTLTVTDASVFIGDISDSLGPVIINDSLDVATNLLVTGTSDFQGQIADSHGDLVVNDNLAVTTNLVVTGTSNLIGDISDSLGPVIINDSLDVATNLVVTGTTNLIGDVSDSLGPVIINDSLDVATNLVVTGTSDLQGDVSDSVGAFTIADALDVTGEIKVTGDVHITSTLTVTGTSDFIGDISDSLGPVIVNDSLDVATNLVVTGTSDLQGNVSDSGGVFTIADDLAVTGEVRITSATYITSTLVVTDTSDFIGKVTHVSDVDTDGVQNYGPMAREWTTSTITITGTLYTWDGAEEVSITLSNAGVEEGDVLYIINLDATYNLIVIDTTATSTGGDRTLGKDDVIGFLYIGATWVEFIASDNS